MTPTGLEHPADSLANSTNPQWGDAKSGTDGLADPDLRLLVEAWPTLPVPLRSAVVALVRSHGEGGDR